MDLHLRDKAAVVTGSSRGIGRGIARALLREGARVALTGRNNDDLQRTASELIAEFGAGQVLALACDLARDEGREALAGFVAEAFGRLDVLVCNVGSGRSVPVLDEDEAEWRRMLEINLLTAAGSLKALRPLLEEGARRSRDRGGAAVVFVSSICGHEVLGCPAAYAAAKAALDAYARNVARPLGRLGVRVNLVAPGNVLFPGSIWERKLAEDEAAVRRMLDREVPLNRLGSLEEVADVVAFLASPRAAFVSGAEWVVDGGQVRS